MLYAVGTGLLTSICAICALITVRNTTFNNTRTVDWIHRKVCSLAGQLCLHRIPLCAIKMFVPVLSFVCECVTHFHLVYLNALLAMLNSRKRGRDRSVSGQRSIGGLEAIRLPRIPGTSFRSGSTTVGKVSVSLKYDSVKVITDHYGCCRTSPSPQMCLH